MSETAPIGEKSRVRQLDVLRGVAVLGILMVNAASFAMPVEVGVDPRFSPLPFEPADGAIWWTARTFFEGKFITLFSLLFGVSLFLVGGDRDDPVREPVLVRRLIWLAVFGVLHGALIWPGDILLQYALIGFVMFWFRSWPARKLLTVGALWLLAGSLVFLGFHAAMEAAPADALEPSLRMDVQGALGDYRGDLAQVQAANLSDWIPAAIAGLILYGARTLGLMMLGLGLYKSGVLEGRGPLALYLGLMAAGMVALVAIGRAAAAELGGAGDPMGLIGAPNSVLSPVAGLGYLGAIVLALKTSAGRAIGGLFAPAGRMAFTNYLTQSLIMTTIFYGARGFGWYGRLDWSGWIWIVLAVWAVQLVWSPLWLSRFTMGPFEWVWRRLSYGRDIPLRRRGAVERTALPAA